MTAFSDRTSTAQSGALQKDLVASIVVFLVALPLCMGIAIASGAPPATGLLTGIIGGLVVGFIAGSPLQVSGPAAGLSVIVYQLIQEHGLAVLGIIVLLAGLIQLLAGLLRLGQWFRAVSPAVIQGMLAGIGILILGSQFHVMVDDKPVGGGLENLMSIPAAIWKGIMPLDGSLHHQAAMIGFLSIVCILLWQNFAPKRIKFLPAPLVAVVVATLVAVLVGLKINRVDVPSNLIAAMTFPTMGIIQNSLNTSILIAAIGMAVVASAETLLCATAVDAMHSGERTKYDKELAAQGVGNMLCGIVGALPMTGVIVRSSANVASGGVSRRSAILHGAWLLIFVAALPFVLAAIPTASLAAVLVYTGYRLVNVQAIKKLSQAGRGELIIYIATVVGVVSIDLLTGVLIGVGLSLVKLLYAFSHLDVSLEEEAKSRRVHLFLDGTATLLRLPKLAATLEQVKPNTELHVHFEHLDYIDHACLELFIEWERQHESTGGSLVIDWNELTARFRTPRPLVNRAEQRISSLDSGASSVNATSVSEEALVGSPKHASPMPS